MQALGQYLQNKHGIDVAWATDNKSATLRGKYLVIAFDGKFFIKEDSVTCIGKDPGMFWRKKATQYIKNKLAMYLNPNTKAEDLPRH